MELAWQCSCGETFAGNASGHGSMVRHCGMEKGRGNHIPNGLIDPHTGELKLVGSGPKKVAEARRMGLIPPKDGEEAGVSDWEPGELLEEGDPRVEAGFRQSIEESEWVDLGDLSDGTFGPVYEPKKKNPPKEEKGRGPGRPPKNQADRSPYAGKAYISDVPIKASMVLLFDNYLSNFPEQFPPNARDPKVYPFLFADWLEECVLQVHVDHPEEMKASSLIDWSKIAPPPPDQDPDPGKEEGDDGIPGQGAA